MKITEDELIKALKNAIIHFEACMQNSERVNGLESHIYGFYYGMMRAHMDVLDIILNGFSYNRCQNDENVLQ